MKTLLSLKLYAKKCHLIQPKNKAVLPKKYHQQDTNMYLDVETILKLRRDSARTHEPIAELIRRYANALDKLLEVIPETSRVSITDFALDLATSTIKQQVTPIFGLSELPYEIQEQVRAWDAELRKKEDGKQ